MADAFIKAVIDTDQLVRTIKAHIRERIEPLVLAVRAEGHHPENTSAGCGICSALALLVEDKSDG